MWIMKEMHLMSMPKLKQGRANNSTLEYDPIVFSSDEAYASDWRINFC
ncbi:hypothetical protein SLEP1_g9304 [Rubroshorea leprosula]|uniref:Uncharacterized protein n=1 Tax=Rubroshorea leprosula TaxID=152421 RepID=A0AAV5I4I3_9ROSI|nr:hypothetical protein SLEP1_g9304 [Rubroshorea leprosula]